MLCLTFIVEYNWGLHILLMTIDEELTPTSAAKGRIIESISGGNPDITHDSIHGGSGPVAQIRISLDLQRLE